MTNAIDVIEAITLGGSYVGFVINFPRGKRNISIEQFDAIVEEVIQKGLRSRVKFVLVSVDLEADFLEKNYPKFDVIQFHGDDTPAMCRSWREKVEVWKSFQVREDAAFYDEVKAYNGAVDRFLLDTSSAEDKASDKRSESFTAFKTFQNLQQQGYPLALAGGLNAENISTYVDQLQPEIVDLVSGVEEYPGKKDLEKMKNFVAIVRSFNQQNT